MTDLEALVKAWLDKEPDSGLALHDAMEEAGWPWNWIRRASVMDLFLPDHGWDSYEYVANVYPMLEPGTFSTNVYNGTGRFANRILNDYRALSVEDGKRKAEECFREFLAKGGMNHD